MSKPKYHVGEIVENRRNKFRRKIVSVDHIDQKGQFHYTYNHEELDEEYNPTGNFDKNKIGHCTENHLKSWKKGK